MRWTSAANRKRFWSFRCAFPPTSTGAGLGADFEVKRNLTLLQALHLFPFGSGRKLWATGIGNATGRCAMSEFQKIAIGLLGMTHPETHRLRLKFSTDEADETGANKAQRGPAFRPGALLRAAKLAFAAFVAGSRAIPLGENG